MHRFREPVNGFTHMFGIVLGILGLAWLVAVTYHDLDKMLSMLIYGVSVILLYSASTTFHLVKGSAHMELWLRRLDHAAIYIMIAGTYTPLVYNVLNGFWRWGILSLVWLLALVGVVYKLLFLQDRYRNLSVALYLGMGWLGLVTLPQAVQRLDAAALLLVVAGGIIYSAGALIFMVQRPNFHRHFGHHELWHVFVLGGSVCHFAAIMGLAAA
jgi:hemolysin III